MTSDWYFAQVMGGKWHVMLYDFEDYGGRAPAYRRGVHCRYSLDCRGSRGATLWSVGFATYDEARGRVPVGGEYRDRTGNYPSPMLPIEVWLYDYEPPAPAIVAESAP